MTDKTKTKDMLLEELSMMRRRIAELTDRDRAHRQEVVLMAKHIEKLKNILRDTVVTLASTVDTKDPYKTGHQKRTATLVHIIARKLGYAEKKIQEIYLAALVHDIGKLNVPSELLTKTGQLLEKDYMLIKDHPRIGANILQKVEFAPEVCEMVFQHHERMNGSGYPRGLKGEEIMPEARILAVADVMEAIASQRSYRKSFGIDKALKEVTSFRGMLYDPKVVNVCVELFKNKTFRWDEKTV